ncbi:NAD(P)H-dependent glycerol-3-phosphate dehydrogenase [Tropicibacter naphthalenivorans]|uniref:Glycerol-3-phosphate dehydrogenase [NAD(P)+] n=1 Tax=Tropicibacter naphthalenivorans TaxID=441103 RepID=A0A0P1GUV5_9RHOB|nr:NAD(P)H-dependent glycerol-3-phosphate dehydrogenase [Tropicibacter naphthalenivorans]CUH79501.1 Glycerol-3-phosphate dehydrogenase [NAD(P)+] [Tropicibacter naphthalenivorans]SMC73215.1 glycerol-3-phosphate dehydrogenase (NAD(P)+) [Tropicibacter naphthalenivorans]
MIAVLGGGAFGTALAVSLARDGRNVALWARDAKVVAQINDTHTTPRLPGVTLPDTITATTDLDRATGADTLLLSVPMQTLGTVLAQIDAPLAGKALVACCKGIDMQTLEGPTAILTRAKPQAIPAVLTGPSFAADIARGLPTALTLACKGETGVALQHALSTQNLRLYRTEDLIGAELGGALKNVIAIACGITIGAGLGDSARAALMTRGFAEMTRFAVALGGQAETLAGLSGLGDLALTCTSELSRNYRFGQSLGRGESFDASVTVEGASTARALATIAQDRALSLPISCAVAALVEGRASVADIIQNLLNRPLKEE